MHYEHTRSLNLLGRNSTCSVVYYFSAFMINDSSDASEEMSSVCNWWLCSNFSNREFGAHPINQARQELGEYHHLFHQLKGYP